MKTKILIVDDHSIVRAGLRCSILTQADMEVVSEAPDGAAALIAIASTHPDVVLMDVSMPITDGIETTRKALAQFPHLKIIMLSGVGDEEFVDRSLKAGASGYVLKDNATTEVACAIRAVMAGHAFLSPEVTGAVLASYKKLLSFKAAAAESPLSTRELEILKLLTEGLRTKEIADRLKIGSKTVETYRARLLTKLKCGSTIELVRYAIREGIALA